MVDTTGFTAIFTQRYMYIYIVYEHKEIFFVQAETRISSFYFNSSSTYKNNKKSIFVTYENFSH